MMLVVSVVWPLIIVLTGMRVVAHNQYQYRHELLSAENRPLEHASAHLGLTQNELAKCDEYTAKAYKESVNDGYRLGTGYSSVTIQGLGMAVLLFLTSAISLRGAWGIQQFPTQSSNKPHAADPQ
jgi:hypothetical protein